MEVVEVLFRKVLLGGLCMVQVQLHAEEVV